MYIYLHIIASCWGLEFQFLSVAKHSKTSLSVYALLSQPTIALGYNNCNIWGSHTGTTEYSILQGCCVLLASKLLPTFRRIVLCSS